MLDPGGRLAGLQPAVWLFEFVAKRGLAFVQRRRAAAPAQQESDAMSDDQAEPDRDKADPMPDLHAFIRRFGGYANVTPKRWAEWDRINAAWQERRR
jgi:hypothetical protein